MLVCYDADGYAKRSCKVRRLSVHWPDEHYSGVHSQGFSPGFGIGIHAPHAAKQVREAVQSVIAFRKGDRASMAEPRRPAT
jgi:hypothetical protein